jgi:hypothetical protein
MSFVGALLAGMGLSTNGRPDQTSTPVPIGAAILSTTKGEWEMAENGHNQLTNRPRMTIAIEHLDQAQGHMNQVSKVLASMILDLEKCSDFIGRFRDSLIKTIDETGGDVQASIESQIADFIPKNYRPPQPAQGD